MNSIETIAAKINAFADQFKITEEAVEVTSYRQTGDSVRVFFKLNRTVGKTPEQIQKIRQPIRLLDTVIPDPFAEGEDGGETEPTVKPVTSFTVSVADSVKVDATTPASVTILPSDATDQTYTVTAAPEGIVEILNGGALIKGLAAGQVTLTYTANGGTVAPVVKSFEVIEVAPASVAIVPSKTTPTVGDNITFTKTVLPANAANKEVTFVSSDPAILKITNASTGAAEALSAGTATVIATSVADITVKSDAVSIVVGLP